MMIEVQEPRLVMHLEGPREVLYGEKEIYRLQLSNTGTGAAENVKITLMPTGTGHSQPVSHNLGIVEAGREKSVEVELTARQVGRLMINVHVQGDSGVQAELAEEILVRRAALELEVEGPTMQYVGTAASYGIRLGNPGTAPAKNVKLAVKLPPGAKYLSGIDGSRLEADGSELQWTLDRLDAGSEKAFVVKCSLGRAGPARVEVLSTADGELNASANTITQVDAIADLRLEVKDPAGPIPVGEETTYELLVRNRGTKDAQGVEVVAYFSRGIEPVAAEGPRHRISPGQVVFSPIPSLAAGQDLVLRIRARAEADGNHIFRAEVHCKPLGARLVSEETTRFYRAGHVPLKETGIAAEQDASPGAAERPQTVNRRQPTNTPRNASRTTTPRR
jgi:hypothetical protein